MWGVRDAVQWSQKWGRGGALISPCEAQLVADDYATISQQQASAAGRDLACVLCQVSIVDHDIHRVKV